MLIHYIKCKDYRIAFFADTKRFYKINQAGYEFLKALNSGAGEEEIRKKFSLSEEKYDYYKSMLSQNQKSEAEPGGEKSSDKKILPRLVIHLANDCNLRCRYCYANGGTYHSDRGFMERETADKILDVFYSHYDEVNKIQFFGGEPLLNVPILEHVCRRVTEINEKKGTKTFFGMVTNGTIVTDEIVKLVNDYKIQLTVSYDGHPAVNDMMRIFPDGSGTSDFILDNVKKLKEATGQPDTFEVTYNQYHVDRGIKIVDIVRQINKDFPDMAVHLVPAGPAGDNCDYQIKNLDVFADSVTEICKIAMNSDGTERIPSYSLADRIFASLGNPGAKAPLICDAGIGTLSVAVNGDVFPCFMFTDQEDMKLGNIYDDDLFYSEKYIKLIQKLKEFSIKDNNPSCNKCFIKSICNGCLG